MYIIGTSMMRDWFENPRKTTRETFEQGLIFHPFAWMGIDSHALIYGLDHVQAVCNKINKIK